MNEKVTAKAYVVATLATVDIVVLQTIWLSALARERSPFPHSETWICPAT